MFELINGWLIDTKTEIKMWRRNIEQRETESGYIDIAIDSKG